MINEFEFHLRTRLVFGPGSLRRVGEIARELGFRRTLLVADHGLLDAGHVGEAIEPLKRGGVEVVCWHEFDVNPDSDMVESGRRFASDAKVDSIIGLGGGSSMDCAKGINFLLTNGGRMQDYWGYGKAFQPLLPMIGIPTTAGTGSEGQSYALISDAKTHVKMACGDPKATFRVAILDPVLTLSQPASVAAAAGYDAVSHAVETFVTTRRNAISDTFSRESWRLLERNFERVLSRPEDLEARAAMQLGAFYAGVAIENSMLGATHACANPLTARFGTTHGHAIAVLLPQVVRWNGAVVESRYTELARIAQSSGNGNGVEELAARLKELAQVAGLPERLSQVVPSGTDLELLSHEAASQWTGRFNPRPFDAHGAREVYEWAY
ncbi:MAG: iron-containing alcohol dehydrogenase [Acidobacteriota bacterium]